MILNITKKIHIYSMLKTTIKMLKKKYENLCADKMLTKNTKHLILVLSNKMSHENLSQMNIFVIKSN